MNLIQAKALSRFENKKNLNGQKADIRIGGYSPTDETDTECECYECGCKIFFHEKLEDIDDMVLKKHKNSCIECIVKNHTDELCKEQKEFLLRMIGN